MPYEKTKQPSTDLEGYRYIRLQGVEAHKQNDETVLIRVPVRPLTEAEAEVLARLFPHTETTIERLLATESLLGCVVSGHMR